MNMKTRIGSRWSASDGRIFVVDRTETRDGKDWVFYHIATKDAEEEAREYSCYTEAFAHRFREIVNGD
jgi:hypothetical protein